MEQYFGYSNETIKRMITDRKVSIVKAIDEMFKSPEDKVLYDVKAIDEMFKFPEDKVLYERAQSQAIELEELIREWKFRMDETIK